MHDSLGLLAEDGVFRCRTFPVWQFQPRVWTRAWEVAETRKADIRNPSNQWSSALTSCAYCADVRHLSTLIRLTHLDLGAAEGKGIVALALLLPELQSLALRLGTYDPEVGERPFRFLGGDVFSAFRGVHNAGLPAEHLAIASEPVCLVFGFGEASLAGRVRAASIEGGAPQAVRSSLRRADHDTPFRVLAVQALASTPTLAD